MINVYELPEFRFNYGDPRPILLQYMLTLNNFSYPFKNTSQLYQYNSIYFTCNENKKRKLLFPNRNKIIKFIQNSSNKIIILPIKMMQTGGCYSSNRSSHVCYILINTTTNELQRIDIKKYNIDRVPFKLLIKKISNDILDVIKEVLPAVKYIPEIDINEKWIVKHKFTENSSGFPVYVIVFLNEMNNYPTFKTSKLKSLCNRISNKKLEQYWKNYLEFASKKTTSNHCDQDMIKNYGTGRCIKISGNKYNEIIINKPVKKCNDNLIYDYLADKCADPTKIKQINIMLNDISKTKINNKSKFMHLGTDTSVIPSVLFILNKYPHARLIGNYHSGEYNKIVIAWRWNSDSKKFNLTVPEDFWDYWDTAMFDDKVQFMIVLVRLVSDQGGFHANALVYDKFTNEMERFDGLGQYTHKSYGLPDLDEIVEKIFDEKTKKNISNKNFKYFKPIDYCPRSHIFQYKELDDIPISSDLKGSCAIWRLWYIDIRLGNPNLQRKDLIKYAQKRLDKFGNLNKFIKSYQIYVAKLMPPIKIDK